MAVGCAVTSDPTAGGAVAEPVRVRGPTDQEGRRLQQIVRRGSTDAVRHRFARGQARTTEAS
ncbi:transposase [Streptomyces subrutilus]|uniref:Transposase n=1 Tax=Streptomyces subrutilus TaxID=36818 RepID=A0A5P2V0U4_9ACTN|nr:transposase [Streptomyces subrutilus]